MNSLSQFHIPDILLELNVVSVLVRLLLAVFLGGILGLERGRKRRPAGFRTYMIVCLASTLIMMTDVYLVNYFQTGDPARLGAQVISGIGFLGAGSIIVTNKHVKGITTAAGLWASGGLGLAIGCGFYVGAIGGALFMLIVLTSMGKIDSYICLRSNRINIFAEFKSMEKFTMFANSVREMNYDVSDIELKKSEREEDYIAAEFTVKMKEFEDHAKVIEKLGALKGVKFIHELDTM